MVEEVDVVEALVLEVVEVVDVVEVSEVEVLSTTPVDDLLALHSNGQHNVSQPLSKIGNVAAKRNLRGLVGTKFECLQLRIDTFSAESAGNLMLSF